MSSSPLSRASAAGSCLAFVQNAAQAGILPIGGFKRMRAPAARERGAKGQDGRGGGAPAGRLKLPIRLAFETARSMLGVRQGGSMGAVLERPQTPARHRLDVGACYRMAEAVILSHPQRVELIDGIIYDPPPTRCSSSKSRTAPWTTTGKRSFRLTRGSARPRSGSSIFPGRPSRFVGTPAKAAMPRLRG